MDIQHTHATAMWAHSDCPALNLFPLEEDWGHETFQNGYKIKHALLFANYTRRKQFVKLLTTINHVVIVYVATPMM